VTTVEVALESGAKRTFASAIEWPGWSRSGRDEASAIEALLSYAPRYLAVIASRGLKFEPPELSVVERHKGNATTDFGAPNAHLAADATPVSADEKERLLTILRASWDALERAATAAVGKELQKGPRGGGRSVDRVLEHVLAGHQSDLRQIYWREKRPDAASVPEVIEQTKRGDAAALAFAASGEMPEHGPRGGELWTPRHFVRRAAWHILDHAWEIEDRIID
jgi:hypothetical protein